MSDETPPPPPPHGASSSNKPGLPPGNYDIFVVPPHSAGSGFLYLPSLRPNYNSFVAGFACAAVLLAIWTLVLPFLRQIYDIITSGGGVFLLLIVAVGAAFTFGKSHQTTTAGPSTTYDADPPPRATDHNTPGAAPSAHEPPHPGNTKSKSRPQSQTYPQPQHRYARSHTQSQPEPQSHTQTQPEPQSYTQPESQPAPQPAAQARPAPSKAAPTAASSAWERAREDAKRKEQERKAAAERLKWQQARAHEAETREREAREPAEEAERARGAERSTRPTPTHFSDPGRATTTPSKPPPSRPAPSSYHGARNDTEPTSFRPYDTPSPTAKSHRQAEQAHYAPSVSGFSESSYAQSTSTAESSPPASHASFSSKRGPYMTSDPDKIMLGGVHLFTSATGPTRPASQLLSRQGNITDGLILRISTEGLFIDDDVRHEPQREWDIKAWSIKLVEMGKIKASTNGLTVLRVNLRAGDVQQRYVFVFPTEQAWKVDQGLERLRKGPNVRAMGMSGLKESETKTLLSNLGWVS